VYDPYQITSLQIQLKQKKKNVFLSSFVGMIVAVAGIYVVDIFLNLLEKKKLNEIFSVRSHWQIYYASVIAGGINGVLLILIPKKLYSAAAVIVLTTVYETIAGLSGLSTLNDYELVRAIVRDLFLIYFILEIFNLVFKNKQSTKENYEDIELNELLNITLISSIIFNISIISARRGINKIFEIE
jgi:hypothetical protein